MNGLGIVVIGRNEGDRLAACLTSAADEGAVVVYVDSASTDGSVGVARSLGADVVELDPSTPFSAARARNAGFARLREISPGVGLVQFVDGDCTFAEGWLERARREFDGDAQLAVVCGRRRERFPDRSVYNRLADIEWDTPVGEAKSCGGDAMVRAEAFDEVAGFDPTLIAGEEPELCVRLRAKGWRIRRIGAEMTLHDIGMTRFAQWWTRMLRAGHAYAEGNARHGRPPERHWSREVRGVAFWGLLLPAIAVGLAWPTRGWSLAMGLAYPVQLVRIFRRARGGGMPASHALPFATACVFAKFPMSVGLVRYYLGRGTGRTVGLIEYKSGGPSALPARQGVQGR